METKPKPIFAEGIRFFKAREGAPEFVKGQIVIEPAILLDFFAKNNIKEIARFDLLKSKEKGTLYLTLSTWKPTPKAEEPEIPF